MNIGSFPRLALLAFGALFFATAPVLASPWAEVGDNQLRSDVELLAAARLVDGVTTHWPVPWKSLLARLRGVDLTHQPASVQAAARRVLHHAMTQSAPGLSGGLSLDVTNRPATVYGFDGMGRGEGEAQASVEYSHGIFSGRLSLGGFTQNYRGDRTKLNLDESHLSVRLGDVRLYGGWLSHWWGPGQISALQLSNNARPMPQIGFERASTEASSWPVLRWIGPWQFEFFAGAPDGPRVQRDSYFGAFRLTFNPLPGLEVGLSRITELCGQGHPCVPLRDYFHFSNNPLSPNATSDEGQMDFKYSHTFGGVPVQAYVQLMNEDYSPITHSGTSHLFGASVFLPTQNNPVKVTVEYTDSVPTRDIFSFGDVIHGFAYNNAGYPDGMRYRGRTLGFSLDSDSRLLSLQAGWSDASDRFYQLSLHHATISNANIASVYPYSYNVVTTAPVIVNMAEARVSLPLVHADGGFKVDLAGRLQDDQPRPHKGVAASIELALRAEL